MAELIAKAVPPLQDLFPGKHDCLPGGENGRLRVDQNRIGVRRSNSNWRIQLDSWEPLFLNRVLAYTCHILFNFIVDS